MNVKDIQEMEGGPRFWHDRPREIRYPASVCSTLVAKPETRVMTTATGGNIPALAAVDGSLAAGYIGQFAADIPGAPLASDRVMAHR